ncbi:hypothetical protein HPP92_008171 [Vanilla planifolia]|uniref:Histone acetyltransferase n=1 Tax=Vanilla planifolia TaxID=51239 RepID=A0A835RJH7_VANPL|nr:hypothetical protein HPP92_008171 [Vanilla planifolia]
MATKKLANEIHCSATRKNKEWQEKLPFVVLKAEEIMYSKANSEAEYMDLTTLWERVNDAIDTIIRKDDANESADFLHPCIEAALNLGCVPGEHRGLSATEAADVSLKPKDNEDILQVGSTSMPPLQPKQSINLQGSVNQCRVKYSGLEPEVHFKVPDASQVKKGYFDKTNLDFSFQVRDVENAWTHEVDDWGSSSSCDAGDSCGPLPCRPRTMNLDSSLSSAQQKGFDFFCLDANDEPQESCLSKWSSDADCAIFMSACSRH